MIIASLVCNNVADCSASPLCSWSWLGQFLLCSYVCTPLPACATYLHVRFACGATKQEKTTAPSATDTQSPAVTIKSTSQVAFGTCFLTRLCIERVSCFLLYCQTFLFSSQLCYFFGADLKGLVSRLLCGEFPANCGSEHNPPRMPSTCDCSAQVSAELLECSPLNKHFSAWKVMLERNYDNDFLLTDILDGLKIARNL